MGADRRGPLAAFIILAIIAVILLVTSVRSQAAPGWFHTTVVAGPVSEPHLWGLGDATEVVEDGVVLVRAVSHGSAPATSSTRRQVTGSPRHDLPASTPQQPAKAPTGDGATERPGDTAAPPDEMRTSSGDHDHGRHLGWYQTHGRDVRADGAADTEGNSHGNGHANDRARGHDHSRWWLPVGVGSHGRGH